jgi:chemotaxis protein MotB
MKYSSGNTIQPQPERAASVSYRRLMDGFNETVDSDSNWLISLSDLLSLLLVFFIMFFVMTKGHGANEKTRSAEGQSHVPPLAEFDRKAALTGETIRDEIKSGINDLDLGDDVSILGTNREIIITIKENVTFRPGEADMLDSAGPVLDNIADIIHKYPYYQAEIIGHTDNVPINTSRYPSNWELSVARATSVLKYLINNRSIDSSRLSIKGNADQEPVAPNDTPANRAQNRRVEIRLKRVEA